MRVAWLLVLAGCFKPVPPENVPCQSSQDCPAPQVCDESRCTLTPSATDAMPDSDLACACAGDQLDCGAGLIDCALGCVDDPTPRCGQLVPSNGVSLGDLALVDTAVAIDGTVTIDTDTGEITGAITRGPGLGLSDAIAYAQLENLGVFTFHALAISENGIVRFTGSRAAVFVVETTATVAGTIDGTGGCATDPSCAGPGGGTGGKPGAVAAGCGAGGNGLLGTAPDDGGGAGGGGGAVGGAGGLGDPTGTGGLAGVACLATTGEPLRGGSGGGTGSEGTTTIVSTGGGGGGAFQLTAVTSIAITGTITMGGGGGAGGSLSPTNGGGGAGGGAGGTILIEAPSVDASGVLAANGGGGGEGGQTVVGASGANGDASDVAAAGGTGGAGGDGGSGGVNASPAGPGAQAAANAGGGGGAVGVIFVRSAGPATLTGVVSPPAGTDSIRAN